MLFIPPERLEPMVRATVESGLQFTAHSVGDGAVHALLDAYEEVNKQTPVAPTRPCITHSNFMSREAIDQAARLGVVVDIQPAWLYLDTRTLAAQFGYDRLRYFQPLKSLFEAGVIGRRRLGPHAEDRLVPVDQPVQPVPGHVGRRSPARPRVTRGGSTPRRP